VTVRDIADRAGVQHSLVHRHFQTKERLLAEVVSRTVQDYADVVAQATDPTEGFVLGMNHIAENPAGFLALASARIGQTRLEQRRPSFPGVALHRQQLEAAATTGELDPEVVTVATLAMAAGWALFEDWWMSAAGRRDRRALRSEIADVIRRLVQREAGLEPRD
jgi:AcrR family transcriptional regulator